MARYLSRNFFKGENSVILPNSIGTTSIVFIQTLNDKILLAYNP